MWVNDIDWTVLPLDADIGKGGTTTCIVAFEDQPFTYYAGPWAEAMWTCQNDPDVDDVDEALEYAWEDNTDGDTAKYEDRVAMLDRVAAQFGLGSVYGVGRAWEIGWGDELEDLWPAIEEVAETLIHGEEVNHEKVQAAIDRGKARLAEKH